MNTGRTRSPQRPGGRVDGCARRVHVVDEEHHSGDGRPRRKGTADIRASLSAWEPGLAPTSARSCE